MIKYLFLLFIAGSVSGCVQTQSAEQVSNYEPTYIEEFLRNRIDLSGCVAQKTTSLWGIANMVYIPENGADRSVILVSNDSFMFLNAQFLSTKNGTRIEVRTFKRAGNKFDTAYLNVLKDGIKACI